MTLDSDDLAAIAALIGVAQTGDSFARLGAPSILTISTDIAANAARLTTIQSLILALPSTDQIAAQIGTQIISDHGSGSYLAADAEVSITPLQANAANPRYSTNSMANVAAGSSPLDSLTVLDGNKNPVNLSGKTVRLVFAVISSLGDNLNDVTDDILAGSFKYETGGGGITVGGANNNILSIQHDATKNGTPGHYRVFLWNVTDRVVIMRGDIDIEPSVFDVP